jgi:signal transduction histidine kinase
MLTNGNGFFNMEISDNGNGFNWQKSKTGHHGIENMRMRAERIGGTLQMHSDKGTCIILKTRAI